VLILALGIGANTAVFSVVNGVLLKPLSYRDSNRLVTLTTAWKSGEKLNHVTLPDFLDWRHQSSVSAMAYYRRYGSRCCGLLGPYRFLSMSNRKFFIAAFKSSTNSRRCRLSEDKPEIWLRGGNSGLDLREFLPPINIRKSDRKGGPGSGGGFRGKQLDSKAAKRLGRCCGWEREREQNGVENGAKCSQERTMWGNGARYARSSAPGVRGLECDWQAPGW
jgi:hypothetical protein